MAEKTHAENMIAALLREREQYVERELPDRIQQVNKQLAAFGYTDPPASEAKSPSTRTDVGPKGRRSKPTETT